MSRPRPRFKGQSLGDDFFASSVQRPVNAPALLLSDLHFGDGSKTDLFGTQDQRLMDFIDERCDRVETIVFLGDIVDLPQAWTARRVERAHPALFRYLRRLVAQKDVVFVRGNHDWKVDYEALFPGSIRTEAVLFGERVLAWHGHQVDLALNPGVTDAPLKTYLHAVAERLAGCRLVPPLEHHDSTANRIALSLAVAGARLTMARAGRFRARGQDRRAQAREESVRYLARSVCGDPADIFGATTRTALGDPYEAIICGHSHQPGVISTPRGVFANTGTWVTGLRTCATWTGTEFVVEDIERGRPIRDEHYVSIPEQTEPSDLFEWWKEQWRNGVLPIAHGAGSR